jgi:hypothetical protein
MPPESTQTGWLLQSFARSAEVTMMHEPPSLTSAHINNVYGSAIMRESSTSCAV